MRGCAPPGVGEFYDLAAKEIAASLAEAKRVALDRVLAAEKLEDAGQKDTERWKVAATAARQAQVHVERHEARAKAAKRGAGRPQVRRREGRQRLAKLAGRGWVDDAHRAGDDVHPPLVADVSRTDRRRLAFARWIADRANPLTARVAVNHIWLRHFGQAIVPSVFDFGRNGRPPSHPALLDWLAAEFMDRGWSMKHMHRLIVTSHAYRQASTPDGADQPPCDPDNKYLWRMTPRRAGGRGRARQRLLRRRQARPDDGRAGHRPHAGPDVPRRSMYFRHAAEKQMEFLQIFDGAAVTECYQRAEHRAAAGAGPGQQRAVADCSPAPSPLAGQRRRREAFMTARFEHVLSRPPTEEETARVPRRS